MSQHKILQHKEWKDPYPDTFRVSVELSNETGDPFVVVSGDAVWLDDLQVYEVISYLEECRSEVISYLEECRSLVKALKFAERYSSKEE